MDCVVALYMALETSCGRRRQPVDYFLKLQSTPCGPLLKGMGRPSAAAGGLGENPGSWPIHDHSWRLAEAPGAMVPAAALCAQDLSLGIDPQLWPGGVGGVLRIVSDQQGR